jgi:hypothetical protein
MSWVCFEATLAPVVLFLAECLPAPDLLSETRNREDLKRALQMCAKLVDFTKQYRAAVGDQPADI